MPGQGRQGEGRQVDLIPPFFVNYGIFPQTD